MLVASERQQLEQMEDAQALAGARKTGKCERLKEKNMEYGLFFLNL